MMLCILCRLERPPGNEHPFALAIGGSITIDRVCTKCDNTFGSTIDAALSDHGLIKMHRQQLGLSGHGGTVPNVLGKGVLAGDPAQTVIVDINPASPGATVHLQSRKSRVLGSDGTELTQYHVDSNDRETIEKIVNRNRVRAGQNALEGEALSREIDRIALPLQIETPVVNYELVIDLYRYSAALLKIAYELTWVWYGDEYLNDPLAMEISAVLQRGVPSDPKEPIPRGIGSTALFGDTHHAATFSLWDDKPDLHIAILRQGGSDAFVAIRIFNALTGLFCVSHCAARYKTPDQFLSIDPVTGSVRRVTLAEELGDRIASMNANATADNATDQPVGRS